MSMFCDGNAEDYYSNRCAELEKEVKKLRKTLASVEDLVDRAAANLLSASPTQNGEVFVKGSAAETLLAGVDDARLELATALAEIRRSK